MSSGAPDLFVICRHCGSEVSPYITECPYCGSRLRKRAPKLDRDGRPADQDRRGRRRSRSPAPSLGPLRRGEIPGIRIDARPYATIALVLVSLVMLVLVEANALTLLDTAIVGKPDGEWWRVVTAAFVYGNNGYAFVTLVAIAVFGWLLERRHGPLAIVLLFLAGGAGGLAVAAATTTVPYVFGANGAALALLVAWAIPDLLESRRGREVDGDLLGAAVMGVVLLLLPFAVATPDTSETAGVVAGAVGLLVGAAAGYPLARFDARRG